MIVDAPEHCNTVSKSDRTMETEYLPIFLEERNGSVKGTWMHVDARIDARIMPLAYTSDLGIFRLMVGNLDAAAGLLKKKGLIIRRTDDAVEVVPDGSCGLLDILAMLAECGIDTELTGIIPGIYQG